MLVPVGKQSYFTLCEKSWGVETGNEAKEHVHGHKTFRPQHLLDLQQDANCTCNATGMQILQMYFL